MWNLELRPLLQLQKKTNIKIMGDVWKKNPEWNIARMSLREGGAKRHELLLLLWHSDVYMHTHTERKRTEQAWQKNMSKTLSIHFVQVNWFYGLAFFFNELFAMTLDHLVQRKRKQHNFCFILWLAKAAQSQRMHFVYASDWRAWALDEAKT